METYDRLVEKWSPVLNEESAGGIKDSHKRAVTAVVLENTEKALREERSQHNYMTENAGAPGNATSIPSINFNTPPPISITKLLTFLTN